MVKFCELFFLTIIGFGKDVFGKLPVFSISIDNHVSSIVKEYEVLGNFSITNDTSSGNLGIKLRGSSSLYFPKNSYRFETRDKNNSDVDMSLLGLPKEEDFVLQAPYVDKTLMRNVLVYDLSNSMGRYASRTRFVDLNINGEYRGIYVLMEKLKRDKNRIDISKKNSFILKVDRGNQNDSFISNFGSEMNPDESANVYYVYDYPKLDEITQEQKNYISGYVNDFETALSSENFMANGKRYESYIDVGSFIDFIILNEISNNKDAYRLSTFMHKDEDGKLEMGPVWDFNIGFGNSQGCESNVTDKWSFRHNVYCKGDELQTAFWWTRLFEDTVFVTKFKDRWNQLRVYTLSEETIFSKIDTYVSELSESLDDNFEKWDILGVKLWYNNFVGNTYEEEVDFLKSWISDRLTWMDGAIQSGSFEEYDIINDANSINDSVNVNDKQELIFIIIGVVIVSVIIICVVVLKMRTKMMTGAGVKITPISCETPEETP